MRILQGLNVFLNNMMGRIENPYDSDFGSQVVALCMAHMWEPSAVDNQRVVIPFRMGAMASSCLLITNGSPFQGMYCFGSLAFPKNRIPHDLSTALMSRSASLNVGTWLAITGGDGEVAYACRETFNLYGMRPPAFRALAEALLDEADAVERIARSRNIIR